MITQSAFDFTTKAPHCVHVYVGKAGKKRREEREEEEERGGLDRGRATDMCERKKETKKKNNSTFIYRQARTHTQTWDVPSTSRLSVAFLSLPLAVSQIPDDVLTGGLSDWRWGCVMTDQGLYQWPAHCQLAVWRLTGRLKPKTAAVPAWLPASLHISVFFFSFLFNP